MLPAGSRNRAESLGELRSTMLSGPLMAVWVPMHRGALPHFALCASIAPSARIAAPLWLCSLYSLFSYSSFTVSLRHQIE